MAKLMLYDGDCGFCTSSARIAERLGTDLETSPWQSRSDLAALGVSPERAAETLHVVDGTDLLLGHHAVARALRGSRPRWARIIGHAIEAPLVSPVAAAAYSVVARNRHRLPGSTCQVAR